MPCPSCEDPFRVCIKVVAHKANLFIGDNKSMDLVYEQNKRGTAEIKYLLLSDARKGREALKPAQRTMESRGGSLWRGAWGRRKSPTDTRDWAFVQRAVQVAGGGKPIQRRRKAPLRSDNGLRVSGKMPALRG